MSSYVPHFCSLMQRIIDKNSWKIGWCRMTPKQCVARIRQETKELAKAIQENKSVDEVSRECADIANFAMFCEWNYKRVAPEGE